MIHHLTKHLTNQLIKHQQFIKHFIIRLITGLEWFFFLLSFLLPFKFAIYASIYSDWFFLTSGIQEKDRSRQKRIPKSASRIQSKFSIERCWWKRGYVRWLRQLQSGCPAIWGLFATGNASISSDVFSVNASRTAELVRQETADEHEHGQSRAAATTPEHDTVAHGTSAKSHEHAAHVATTWKWLYATGRIHSLLF